MAEVRIKVNRAGFRDLRTSAAVEALLEKQAQALAGRANAIPSTTDPAATDPYYEVEEASDRERARRRVRSAGPRAARHEAKTQALQKSV